MTATVSLLAPNPGWSINSRDSSTTYAADAYGVISGVPIGPDLLSLLSAGCKPISHGDNYVATTDPGVGNDNTQDYSAGSVWLNTSTGEMWRCISAATGAALWFPETAKFIGRLLAANFNVTTDQAIPLFIPATATYRVTKITAKNTSVAGMSTAAGGVYPAASKGGTALVASGQAYSGLTNAATAVDLTLAAASAVQAAATKLYLSLTTGQGAAATVDLFVYGDVYA